MNSCRKFSVRLTCLCLDGFEGCGVEAETQIRGSSWWWWSWQPGPWCLIVVRGSQDRGLVGLRVVGSSPTVVGWSRCNRTRRPRTRPDSVPPAELSSSVGGPNKDPVGSIFFWCVCVCGGTVLHVEIVQVLLLTVHCLHIRD